MALTVEDGTGLSAADSYISLADFKAYCDDRGYDYSAFSDTVIEQKLRLAADYIDGNYRFKGTRESASQALEFPRDGLTDWSGLTITGLPVKVTHAASEAAFAALGGEDLTPNLDRGGMIKSESVGPISTTFADGAPVDTVFTTVRNKIRQFTRDKSLMDYSPSYVAPPDPVFSGDMHERTEVDIDYDVTD